MPVHSRQSPTVVQEWGMRHQRLLPLLAFPLAALLAACGGGGEAGSSAQASASSCEGSPDEAVYNTAIDEYIKGLTPTPRRFLNAVGTDSALPDPVFQAVMRRGPSYLYPPDSAGRKVVLDKLGSVGSWSSLLVTWHGMEKHDSTATIRLGGHYVGGDDDGLAAPRKAIVFQCDTTPWTFSRTADESST